MGWQRWRPKLTRAHSKSSRQRFGKTWKAWSTSRKYPVFEVGIHPGDVFSRGQPFIDATRLNSSGCGTVWSLDLEDADKLILILEEARSELRRRLECAGQI